MYCHRGIWHSGNAFIIITYYPKQHDIPHLWQLFVFSYTQWHLNQHDMPPLWQAVVFTFSDTYVYIWTQAQCFSLMANFCFFTMTYMNTSTHSTFMTNYGFSINITTYPNHASFMTTCGTSLHHRTKAIMMFHQYDKLRHSCSYNNIYVIILYIKINMTGYF